MRHHLALTDVEIALLISKDKQSPGEAAFIMTKIARLGGYLRSQ
jgi:hypothetical protein